jgi:cobalt-zinc-cadmium efflux system protein
MALHHAHGHSHGHAHDRAHPHGPEQRAATGDARTRLGPDSQREGAPDVRASQLRRLRWVLLLTALFMVAEVVGGILSRSLALLADAGHMFTDVGAIALSLFAISVARRPPSLEKTYGYVRLEILAALMNGATLLVIAGFICWEAWQRLRAPVVVNGPVLMSVATVGMVVNVAAAALLHSHAKESLNVRGAYLHVLGDLLGSFGALAAGAAILLTGWSPADSVVSVLIALLILASAWRLVREATDVLLEAAPSHIDMLAVRSALEAVPELHDVHDLHVWTLTSGFVALSGHGVVDDPARNREVLTRIQDCLARFGIEHITFQLEPRPLYQMKTREGPRGGASSKPADGAD